MKHEVIWSAVDNLAKKNNYSTSGMAKIVGLDATTFNKSKRFRNDGKRRWPSLASINKLLAYFDISFEEFCSSGGVDSLSSIPINYFSKINMQKNVIQNTSNWEEMGQELFSNVSFAINLDTKKFEPIYKNNTTIIIADAKEFRKGDRVFIINKFNEVCLYELSLIKSTHFVFISLENASIKEDVKEDDILTMKRIVWASQ